MDVSIDEIRRRWIYSWEAYEDAYSKYDLINQWLFAFERHLKNGEEWGESFRFPELYGLGQRKFDNLVSVLPEVKVRGRDNESVQLQGAYDHFVRVSNLEREKLKAIYDAVYFGRGCLYVGVGRDEREVKTEEGPETRLFYDGLIAERVDFRDLIPAYSANQLHDHSGVESCPYVFRRRIYYIETFRDKYSDPKYKNVDEVQGTTYGGAFFGDTRRVSRQEAVEKTAQNDYVAVMEYWDQEKDMWMIFANNFDTCIYESPVGIPMSHKKLPFHFYYDYRRFDSITGIGEIELNMPYNLFRERVLNLVVDNATLELQPFYFVDANLTINEDEAEIEPGAMITARGLDGGKLADHIMPFRAGGVTADIPGVISMIESSQIAASGDDVRSLHESSDQTLGVANKKEMALNKRINANVMRNTLDTEWHLANQILTLIKNELSEPFKDELGKTKFRKVQLQGYSVVQNKPDEAIERQERREGQETEFFMNKEVSKGFDEREIEIIPLKLDEMLKRDNISKMMELMQTVMNTAQVAPELLQGMDLMGVFKWIALEMDIDTDEIFPVDEDQEGIDVIDQENNEIAAGQVPEPKPEKYDLVDRYKKLSAFEQSTVYDDLPKRAKDAAKAFKSLILNYAATQTNQAEGAAGSVAGARQVGQQGPVPGV